MKDKFQEMYEQFLSVMKPGKVYQWHALISTDGEFITIIKHSLEEHENIAIPFKHKGKS